MLTDRDSDGAAKVALINESTARKYFEERDAIGQTLKFTRKGEEDSAYQIVGIVQDTKRTLTSESLRAGSCSSRSANRGTLKEGLHWS